MIDEAWLRAALAEPATTADPAVDSAVDSVRELLSDCAAGFADRRTDVLSAQVRWPRRGLHPDEAASFLRAVELGYAKVDDAGFVTVDCVRPKTPPGRYALLSRSGSGVAVNLEYLIQVGATAELVADLGWPPGSLDFERGEFDTLGFGPDDRVVLAVEAKARVTGADSLEKLIRAWMAINQQPDAVPADNAGRKYGELHRLCDAGPVAVWLVAAGARWSFLAARDGDRLALTPVAASSYAAVMGRTSAGRQVLSTVDHDASLHQPGTKGAEGRCSWFCDRPARYTTRVREVNGAQSTFALCEVHRRRVEDVYGGPA